MPKISRTHPNQISLAAAVYGYVILSAVVAVAFIVFIIQAREDAFELRINAAAVSVRGQALQLLIEKSLNRDVQATLGLAAAIPTSTEQQVNAIMATSAKVKSGVSRIDYATVDGLVVASSAPDPKRTSVSSEPWFRNGLKGLYIGDGLSADQISMTFIPAQATSLSLINVSAPATDSGGQTLGVVRVSIGYDALRKEIADMADALDIDAYLVNQAGKVFLAVRADGKAAQPAPNLALLNASSGTPGSTVSSLQDGMNFLSTIVPRANNGDALSLGWSVVAQIPYYVTDFRQPGLSQSIAILLVAMIVMLCVSTIFFVRIFIRPLGLLTVTAAEIAEGKDRYPKEMHSTGLCCTNPVRDSSRESSVVAVAHEQTHTRELQDQELALL